MHTFIHPKFAHRDRHLCYRYCHLCIDVGIDDIDINASMLASISRDTTPRSHPTEIGIYANRCGQACWHTTNPSLQRRLAVRQRKHTHTGSCTLVWRGPQSIFMYFDTCMFGFDFAEGNSRHMLRDFPPRQLRSGYN